MAKSKITELDFDGIKDNLKLFLNSQDEFTDYNFEGSGFNVLLDILAFNTHYLAYNLNFSSSEMFLDSATLRSSILSHAKTLGYTPRSVKSSKAVINVTINEASQLSSATILKGTKFVTSIANTNYNFIVNEDITAQKENGVIEFSNVNIYEGTLVKARYVVDINEVNQRFVISNTSADMSTLSVTVQTSETDTTQKNYNLAYDVTETNQNSLVYFLQDTGDGYEVYFGDGIIGKKLEDNNIVIIEYIVCNKAIANGASTFTLTGSIGGISNPNITTVEVSKGGSEAETNESIKKNALINNTSKNRAVTVDDYKLIIQNIYPDVNSISVWGGEDNDPPIYGKVFIAIQPSSIDTLSDTTKQSIVAQLREYTIASIKPEIVNSELIKIICDVSFEYNSKLTAKTNLEIESDVKQKAQLYSNSISRFNDSFRNSLFTNTIQTADDSIVSVINSIRISKVINVVFNSNLKYILNFNNQLFHPSDGYNENEGGILSSTGFILNGISNTMYLDDDGRGNVRIYYLVSSGNNIIKKFYDTKAGVIDYITGKVTIDMNVSSLLNNEPLVVTVQPDKNNINAVREQYLTIDFERSKFRSIAVV